MDIKVYDKTKDRFLIKGTYRFDEDMKLWIKYKLNPMMVVWVKQRNISNFIFKRGGSLKEMRKFRYIKEFKEK